jgi:hypothetical protein
VRPKLRKRQILTCTSLPYSIFELFYPCPQHTAKRPHCAETGLQLVTLATKQKPFCRCQLAKRLEMQTTQNKLQKCCRFVAKHRVSVLLLFCQFSVDPALDRRHCKCRHYTRTLPVIAQPHGNGRKTRWLPTGCPVGCRRRNRIEGTLCTYKCHGYVMP